MTLLNKDNGKEKILKMLLPLSNFSYLSESSTVVTNRWCETHRWSMRSKRLVIAGLEHLKRLISIRKAQLCQKLDEKFLQWKINFMGKITYTKILGKHNTLDTKWSVYSKCVLIVVKDNLLTFAFFSYSGTFTTPILL